MRDPHPLNLDIKLRMGLGLDARSHREENSRADCWVRMWWRRARKELASIFSRIIQARRHSNTKEDDILQSFIDSRYEKVPIPDTMPALAVCMSSMLSERPWLPQHLGSGPFSGLARQGFGQGVWGCVGVWRALLERRGDHRHAHCDSLRWAAHLLHHLGMDRPHHDPGQGAPKRPLTSLSSKTIWVCWSGIYMDLHQPTPQDSLLLCQWRLHP